MNLIQLAREKKSALNLYLVHVKYVRLSRTFSHKKASMPQISNDSVNVLYIFPKDPNIYIYPYHALYPLGLKGRFVWLNKDGNRHP